MSYFAYENGTFRTTFTEATVTRPLFRNSFANWQSGASPSTSIGFNETRRLHDTEGEPFERQSNLVSPAGPERADLPERLDAVRSTVKPTRRTSSRSRSTSSASPETRPISCRGSCAAGLAPMPGPQEPACGVTATAGIRVAPEPARPAPGRTETLAELLARRDSCTLRPRVLDGDLECRLRQRGPGTYSCS